MTHRKADWLMDTPDSDLKWVALKDMARLGAFTVVMLGTGIIVYTVYLIAVGR